jgi:hypothetical protein
MITRLEGVLRVLAVIGLALTGSSIAIGTAIAPAIYPALIA